MWREPPMWLGAWALALTWVLLSLCYGMDMTGHDPRDSFALMALAWRKGMLSLGQDYPWLELAIFNGDWYVSFPSVPALVMLPLTLVFGGDTPNTLMTGLYLLGSYFAAYALARRWRDQAHSAFMALFMTMGCSLLDFSLFGGVWNQAQLLSFFLTTCFALGITSDAPCAWAAGLTCLALSVGCRPFQAVYVPFGLAYLYHNIRPKRQDAAHTLLAMLPHVVLPGLVALALGWYNWARFGNPLEFGHNYLPEFTRDPEKPQLALKYMWPNLLNQFRLPQIVDRHIEFPRFEGWAFWLVDPMYTSAFVAGLIALFRRRWDRWDTLLTLSFCAEIFLLLMHKTMGGWHFGARYLCDLIPMLMLFELRNTDGAPVGETGIGILGIAVNIAGSFAFHLMEFGVWS